MKNFLAFSMGLLLLCGVVRADTSYQTIATATAVQPFFFCTTGACGGYAPAAGSVCIINSFQARPGCVTQADPEVDGSWYVREVYPEGAATWVQLIKQQSASKPCAEEILIACQPANPRQEPTWQDVTTGLAGYLEFSKTDGELANYCAPDPLFGYASAGQDSCGGSPI